MHSAVCGGRHLVWCLRYIDVGHLEHGLFATLTWLCALLQPSITFQLLIASRTERVS